VLVLDRLPLATLTVWRDPATGDASPFLQDSFLQPASGDALRSRYLVPLTAARRTLIALDPLLPGRMGVRVRSEQGYQIDARSASNLAAATYAAIFATALVSLALTVAVREPAYRDFTALAILTGSFLALAHGHAQELPLIGPLLGAWGVGLILMVGTLTAAAAMASAQGLLGLSGQATALARAVRITVWSVAGIGLLLGVLPTALLAQIAAFWAIGLLLVLGVPIVSAARAWWQGVRPAGAQCLLWSLFWLAAAAQLVVLVGGWPDHDVLRWLRQAGALFAVLGLSVVLTDRVIALRQRAETMQQLHASSTAVLRVEQKRRELIETLEAASGTAMEPSDFEWRAFRELLQGLPEVLPLRAVALSVTGFRGFDYLLAEPMGDKPRICALLSERASTLKSLCRARTAMNLPANLTDPRAPLFAVVPLPVPRPGWGALLLEREGHATLSSEELELAAEFAELTFKAIEQGARAVELKRRAETDPLTGLLNHRAGEAHLDSLLRAAQHGGEALAVLFIDVDLLRVVNERFGMPVGDHFLRNLGGHLRPLLRDDDLLYRHGGDEVVLGLPGLAIEQAEALGERLRAQVASQRFRSEQGPIKITVSIGVAAVQPGDHSAHRLVERASRATEVAKGQGRNQVARAKGFGAAGEAPELPPLF
jgi:diguanylate cyclase (GGDEF)-like protein